MYIPKITVSVVKERSLDAGPGPLDSPTKVVELIRAAIGDDERENFIVLLLDPLQKVKALHTVSVGTLSASLVHPRETFRAAVLSGAAGVIVAHNHPSGDCMPSEEDKSTTRRLKQSGEVLGIPLVDHIIITQDSYFSFRERGLI